ncbi:NAD(P)-binding protein [Cutaneotrichosporon oleaginosum]|uniref:NAD(P)-binding protein n=1 Tax=Cutaneotrichosporon oleaginosum TaxID=879819 RepID=A0A0J0XHR5_9TREE|nr:NAD(P)-binding protein [Cutaneotrichosporon oleaginosum]KLT40613.1 NAD(P)-binding protein [Cutaneotrichosporon oleaginosum]TXT03935.1 hypothetical protein COLE_07632 [Cutaneotrichosporon oleaginosum]
MPPPIALIYGAGPGTGAAIARALAPTHALLLMSRSLPQSISRLALDDLPQDRVYAHKYTGAASFGEAIKAAQERWPGAQVKVGVCHAGVPFQPGPFLNKSTEDFKECLDSAVQAWDFSQAVIPALLAANGGTLIITGATMSRRAGANFAAMAGASFARRALAQSLAKEFGAQGVHVAHVVVDGLIATAHVDGMMGKAEPGSRLEPSDIAEVYLDIIKQKPSAWTQELDIRPSKEKW